MKNWTILRDRSPVADKDRHRDKVKNAPRKEADCKVPETKMISDLATHIESLEGALTAKQVSKFTGIGKSVIYDLASRDAIPCYRVGSMVRFDPKDVANWWRGKKQ
jgi:excisionase family DNA binding protein